MLTEFVIDRKRWTRGMDGGRSGLLLENGKMARAARNGRLVRREISVEEQMANVALFAAAPALAEACEMALRDWFELHYGANDIGMAALIRDKLKAALRAAGRLP